jgi:hypothetical protein
MGRNRWMETRLKVCWRVETVEISTAMKPSTAAVEPAAAEVHSWHAPAKSTPRFGHLGRNERCSKERTEQKTRLHGFVSSFRNWIF